MYLTTEQIQRIAALSLDALSGVQIETDDSDQSSATVSYVMIDDPSRTAHAEVYADGSWKRTDLTHERRDELITEALGVAPGETRRIEIEEPVQVVVLNYSISRNEIASVHRVGCRDIERDMRGHGVHEPYGPFDSVEEALADFVDGEMAEMGYSTNDVKVYPCCKG